MATPTAKPPPRRARIFTYGEFNLDALLALASRLRSRPCTADSSRMPMIGSLNLVVFVAFDDGVEWVYRSPKLSGSLGRTMADETASKLLVSEVATLRYLRTQCAVPVPEVYSFSGTSDNDIGAPYILMSKAAGRPLSDYDWLDMRGRWPGFSSPVSCLPLAEHGRDKIMRQLGLIMSRLLNANAHFGKIGSLVAEHDGSYSVGECLSPALVWQTRDALEDVRRGPFETESAYFDSLVSVFITHAKEFWLVPHCFFAPHPSALDYASRESYHAATKRWHVFCEYAQLDGSVENRLAYCVAGHLARQMIPSFASSRRDFVLSHPDLHAGNVFVDDDFNVTYIIDWGSAYAGPVAELLATPGLCGSSSPPPESLTAAYREGFTQGGVKVEPEQWEKAGMVWFFTRLVRLVARQDMALFQGLYEAVHKTKLEDIRGLLREQSEQEFGRQVLAELREYDDEAEDEDKKQREDKITRTRGVRDPATARKLTLMYQMNPLFVADRRLWRWLEDALGPDKSA
ncbi:hypothetical protein VTK73DRAFT_9588 [Phialemonium thermophilum]|uniref:Aminoglycoside phosphotransferase domain-containing protein n=1 Tax=Phialemonium thermophilum TaxID=223376 RepID=A0ABR3W2B6_9PEZI